MEQVVISFTELPPGCPISSKFVHTTGGRPLIGPGFLTVKNIKKKTKTTVLQTLVMMKQP